MRKQEIPPINNQEAPASKAWLGAGLLAALAASLCCITPILALVAGVGGVAATFSWLEPFRPYLIGATVLVLGFAWYQKLKPRTQEEIACACEEDENPSFLQSKAFLGLVTVIAAVLLTFPYYSGAFFPDGKNVTAVAVPAATVANADFYIEGMTCSGCEQSVNHALRQTPGVLKASATYSTGIASVTFDKSKVDPTELAQAITQATGYKVNRFELTDNQ